MILNRCGTVFLTSTAKYRVVTLYFANGTSKPAAVVSYLCKSKQCVLEIFPNFITNLADKHPYSFTTSDYFTHGKYVYLGGQTACERTILRQYSCLLA